MTTTTKPSFVSEVVLALCLSATAGVLASSLMLLFDVQSVLRGLIALLGFAYVLYRLGRSRHRSGRIVVFALWCVAAGATWFVAPPLALYLCIHVTLIWLIRSIYSYASPLMAAADLGLTALAFTIASAVLIRSGNVWLATWCFFLVQALHVVIPASLRERAGLDHRGLDRRSDPDNGAFLQAHRAAEMAVRTLTSRGTSNL